MKRTISVVEDENPKKQSRMRKFKTEVRVTGMRTTIINHSSKNYLIINCTSRSKEEKWRQFSPFFLGPVQVPMGTGETFESKTHENAWQYAKVYKKYTSKKDNSPTKEYFHWAKEGWSNPKAVRFPMGKGAKPEYSLWGEEKLGYVEARKKIYAPTYAKLVMETEAFKELKEIYESGKYKIIWIRDYDGFDNVTLGRNYKEVLNDPGRKMGHGFVLAGCLTNNMFWKE